MVRWPAGPVLAAALAACGAPTAAPPGMPAQVTARYACDDGRAFLVRFDNRADEATLLRDGDTIARLAGQRAASGIWYKGDGYEMRGKGGDDDLTGPDGHVTHCSSR